MTALNAAQIEVLVSFLISQGQTRVRAEELVKEDPARVASLLQAEMDKASSAGH